MELDKSNRITCCCRSANAGRGVLEAIDLCFACVIDQQMVMRRATLNALSGRPRMCAGPCKEVCDYCLATISVAEYRTQRADYRNEITLEKKETESVRVSVRGERAGGCGQGEVRRVDP